MTIIAAIKKNNKVYIGADSFWGHTYYSGDKADSNKIIKFKHFYVAVAGVAVGRDVLEDMSEKYIKPLTSKKAARTFAKKVFKQLKITINDSIVDEDKPLGHFGMIIATKTNIYHIQSDLSCFDEHKYLARGAGADYCESSLEALYDFKLKPKKILKKSLQIACKLSPLCKKPLTIIKV